MGGHEQHTSLDAIRARGDFEAACTDQRLAVMGAESPFDEDARAAAYCLASALGRCRLFGVELGVNDATLPPDIALAATDRALELIACWTDRARQLGKEIDSVTDSEECELCVEDVLSCRMDCWAVIEIVFEAALAAMDDGDAREESLHECVARLGKEIAAYDEALQQGIDCLTLACGTDLLDTWRDALAPEYREVLPWWLDGTIERVANRLEEITEQTLPSATVWRRLMRRDVAPDNTRETADVIRFPAVFQELGANWRCPPALAAAGDDASEPFAVRWRKPDSTLYAQLFVMLPATSKDQEVVVEFLRNDDDEPAIELAEQTVRLAGEEAKIDAVGCAVYRFEDLKLKERSAQLEVGPDREVWIPVDTAGS